jgi:hypothetical protein
MKALISPSEAPIFHVVGWTSTAPYQPISEEYPNSCRVAQVEPDDQTFPVGGDVFWTDCSDNCVADQWYYDTVSQTVNIIVNAPKPAAPDQPIVTGATTA